MKIRKVTPNNRRKAFEVWTRKGMYTFPYALTRPTPTSRDRVASVAVDAELGREGFTYRLESSREGTIHIDHVLEYNRDPDHVADMVLYRLTLEAQRRIEKSPLSNRELIRKLGTSASQFYRLLDPTNYRKSIRQLVSLLHLLDCEVDFVVKRRRSA